MLYQSADARGVVGVGQGGGVKGVIGGRLGGQLQRRLQTGLGRGLAVKLRSVKVQVRFSIELQFNSFELDSEVGGLVDSKN